MKTQDLLAEAVRLHRAGDLKRAADAYRRVLVAKPHSADALNNLGIISAIEGNHLAATEFLSRALAVRPGSAATYNNLANLYLEIDRRDAAFACYRKALETEPDHVDTLRNLATLCEKRGLYAEALPYRERLRALFPESAEAQFDLGRLRHLMGDRRQAAELLRPAALCFEETPTTDPGAATRLRLAGNAWTLLESRDRAIDCFRRSLAIEPNHAESYRGLAVAFAEGDRWDEALASFRKACEVDSGSAQRYADLGTLLAALGRCEEAEATFERALALNSSNDDARWGQGNLWLLAGNFKKGWPEFERPYGIRTSSLPRWDGVPLQGRTILLATEGGLGDMIHFARYAALVKRAGGTVLIESPPALMRILAGCPGVDRVIEHGSGNSDAELSFPLLSLPSLFETDLATIPADVPYLFADPERIEFWRHRLSEFSGLKIGICWQGSRLHRNDRRRSVSVEQFAPLAAVPGVRLFSLQKGIEPPIRPSLPCTDLSEQLDDFMETAAVMKCLDLIISVDTSVVHLAGALGVPVWVAVPFAPDFRWLRDREDSPWYPTMWLVRQPRLGDWDSVFRRTAQELERTLR